MSYRVSWCIPYEGEDHEYFTSLEEVRQWVLENSGRWGRNYDNLTVLEIAREVDIYSIMKE